MTFQPTISTILGKQSLWAVSINNRINTKKVCLLANAFVHQEQFLLRFFIATVNCGAPSHLGKKARCTKDLTVLRHT